MSPEPTDVITSKLAHCFREDRNINTVSKFVNNKVIDLRVSQGDCIGYSFLGCIPCGSYSCPDLGSLLVFQKGRLQEFLDNQSMKVARLSALITGNLYPPRIIPDNHFCCGPFSAVGIETDYGLDGPGSSPGGNKIFRPSRQALGSTQLPVKWVPSLSRE